MKEAILNIPLIDPRRVEHLSGKGTREFIVEITEMFETRCNELREKFEVMQIGGDHVELKKDLHSLKGISLTVGAARLGELCRVLDHILSENNLEPAHELYAMLPGLIIESVEGLKKSTGV